MPLPIEEEVLPETKSPQALLDEALKQCETAQDLWQEGELESALNALDQAYSLLLEADANHQGPETEIQEMDIIAGAKPDPIQQKYDIRYLISRRIIEIYASRNSAVSGKHEAIPRVHNKFVEAEIKRFTGREKNFFIKAYRRSGKYRPMIVAELKKAGLPEELSWLPLIESGFKVRAKSRASALGMWQFIASTGYKFGLKRDQYIDLRMDPEMSTLGAIAYLTELHEIFGDWTTCLAAYNCGEGRVLRVIRAQNVNYLDDFWDFYQRLPRETARYVPRFLASLEIIENPEKYGMDLGEPDPPLDFEKISIEKRARLVDIASAIGVSKKELEELNPELRHRVTPPKAHQLRVPAGKGDALLASMDSIAQCASPQAPFVTHRVRSGQTLSAISKKYRVSVSKIKRANHRIGRRNIIYPGQKLKIPLRGSWQPATRIATSPKKSTTPVTHNVRQGDTLWRLAKKYGTTVKAIQKTNNLSTTRLSIGQKLKIPANGQGLKTYRVSKGDWPGKIAKAHGMRLSRFLKINGINTRSKIFPGQILVVD